MDALHLLPSLQRQATSNTPMGMPGLAWPNLGMPQLMPLQQPLHDQLLGLAQAHLQAAQAGQQPAMHHSLHDQALGL